MDEDTSDLILQLCTRIGTIMEDTSVDALTLRARDPVEWQQTLSEISFAVAVAETLTHATQAIHDRAVKVKQTRAG